MDNAHFAFSGQGNWVNLMSYPWACISILFYYLFIKKKCPMVNSKLLDYYIYIYIYKTKFNTINLSI